MVQFSRQNTWLITGVAGFIGSNLLEALLLAGQKVIGVDNFVTGRESNLEDVSSCVSPAEWKNFTLIREDICNRTAMLDLVARGVDVILHQAALGSVPRSLANPAATLDSNVGGTVNILEVARLSKAPLVFASSSSVYGDRKSLPQVEVATGQPLSPYATSKQIGESLCATYCRSLGVRGIALRYFNVFGPRQNPNGPYAAVIPLWISQVALGRPCQINGDGSTSRDFCFIQNVVEGNLLAATKLLESQRELLPHAENNFAVYNLALGQQTSLSQLFNLIANEVQAQSGKDYDIPPVMAPPRAGDIAHSQASIEAAKQAIGYKGEHKIQDGIKKTVQWYLKEMTRSP